MKTAEEILKNKLDYKIAILDNPDYTFNKVIEAMEEYADQFKQQKTLPTNSELLLAFARYVMPDNFTDKALKNIVAQFLEGKQLV